MNNMYELISLIESCISALFASQHLQFRENSVWKRIWKQFYLSQGKQIPSQHRVANWQNVSAQIVGQGRVAKAQL